MFGFYEPHFVGASPGSAFISPLLFWLHLLIALVLYTNLLIAMFNETCARLRHSHAVRACTRFSYAGRRDRCLVEPRCVRKDAEAVVLGGVAGTRR